MVWSSPRASIGFSRLEASIAPSAAPAPTTVCSSSMNRITAPSASLISFRTALRRSSNSPRNFAPAMIAPRSSETTRLSLSDSGTSPRTIRWARPSAIAVLPTPGSPIRTGLFFVRRESTCMTRRISSSRPTTGSSLPARASAVRSRPYFSRAWYVPSGFGEVTRWPPRTEASAPRMASRPAPWRSRSFWPSPPTSAAPRSRCSVEVYSSPSRRASSWARSTTRLARGSRVSEPPWILARRARIAASSPRNAGRSTPSRRSVSAGHAVVGLDERGQQVLGVEDGALEPLGERWAARTASWAFSVKRSSCMSVSVLVDLVLSGWVRPAGRAGGRGRGSASRPPSPRRTGGSGG